MKDLLIKFKACKEAREWAEGKTWEEVYNTCHRGDWLLWLFKKTNPNDLRLLTLAKGHCAATVLHLMKDQRSIDAVKAAIDFGNGLIDELVKDAYAADAAAAAYAYVAADAYADAAVAAYADAAAAAAYAYAAADAADYDAAAYAAAAYAAADVAKTKNQLETADIVRKCIPIELFNINK